MHIKFWVIWQGKFCRIQQPLCPSGLLERIHQLGGGECLEQAFLPEKTTTKWTPQAVKLNHTPEAVFAIKATCFLLSRCTLTVVVS